MMTILVREQTSFFDIFFFRKPATIVASLIRLLKHEMRSSSAVQIAILFTIFMRTAAHKIKIVPDFDVEMKQSTDLIR